MTELACSEDLKLRLLRQLFASATHDASAAMCRWTNSLVSLTLDEVCEIPLENVCGDLNFGDEPLTMVVLNLEGEAGGSLLLMFNEESARGLAASLLDAPVHHGPGWSELEQSALNETGNILGCAYVNAITRLIDYSLVPSTPNFVVDYGASVLQEAMLGQVALNDSVLIGRTRFQHRNEEVSWWLLFVPTVALREVIERALLLKA
ncbi:MAG: chemotaxis protein [Thermoguttaceae bacterium]